MFNLINSGAFYIASVTIKIVSRGRNPGHSLQQGGALSKTRFNWGGFLLIAGCVKKEKGRRTERGKERHNGSRGTLASFHNKMRQSFSLSCLKAAPLFPGASHNRQDIDENLDDISVEVEGSKDVFFWAQRQVLVAQEKLGVNSQKLQQKKRQEWAWHFYKGIHTWCYMIM